MSKASSIKKKMMDKQENLFQDLERLEGSENPDDVKLFRELCCIAVQRELDLRRLQCLQLSHTKDQSQEISHLPDPQSI